MQRVVLTALALVFFSLGSATSGAAQEEEAAYDTVQLNFWKCDYAEFANMPQVVDSIWTPIAQESVDEGKLLYFQLLRHDWSDEWNFVFYFRAKDIPSFLDAWGDIFSKIEERYPDHADWFFARCSEHKDGFYKSVTSTELPSQ